MPRVVLGGVQVTLRRLDDWRFLYANYRSSSSPFSEFHVIGDIVKGVILGLLCPAVRCDAEARVDRHAVSI